MFAKACHSPRQRPDGNISATRTAMGWQLCDQQGDLRFAEAGQQVDCCVPSEAIARTLIDEWPKSTPSNHRSGSRPDKPMTQIARLALMASETQRQARHREMVAFLYSDTVGYWQKHPQSLYDKQRKEWGGLLNWCEGTLGGAPVPEYGLNRLAVPSVLENNVRDYLRTLAPFSFAAMAFLCPISGSILISLAQCMAQINDSTACALANLEALHQQEQWGIEAETEQRMARQRQAFAIAGQCFRAQNVSRKNIANIKGYTT